MGKRIEDLPLDDTPISPTPERLPAYDERQTAWYRFIEEIEQLLGEGQVTYAEETLRGIQETVLERQYVTPGQRQAVENIEAGARRRRSRWY